MLVLLLMCRHFVLLPASHYHGLFNLFLQFIMFLLKIFLQFCVLLINLLVLVLQFLQTGIKIYITHHFPCLRSRNFVNLAVPTACTVLIEAYSCVQQCEDIRNSHMAVNSETFDSYTAIELRLYYVIIQLEAVRMGSN